MYRGFRTRAAALGALGALFVGGLAGCAPEPDPNATREALGEVTEGSSQLSDAEGEYNASTHPDPIVDPLECTPYLVITLRGTGEPRNGNLLTDIADVVAEARPKEVQTVDIDYPADTDVQEGGTLGARLLIDTLRVQTEKCTEQQFVILGYSQGALVVGDSLSDPETRLVGKTVGEVSEESHERILAVVLYGNPRFFGGAEYNAGTYNSGMNGLLPRVDGSLDSYAELLRDYCVAGDVICQSGLSFDEKQHIAYYTNGMQQDGAAFVIERLDPIGEQ